MNLNLKAKLNLAKGDLSYSFGFNVFGLQALCFSLNSPHAKMGRSARSWGAWEQCDDQLEEMLLMLDQARAEYSAQLAYKSAQRYEDANPVAEPLQ